ncbi:MAG: inverse autotransporter beta domain-containing protein [Negativicutes bacterium]|nr:inverse autotransporter beta domain-containing protein [Negativicutes bacterium]MDR3590647.1 inverse autotransporter beta domain-containing protein [Negativicutes bacterium]
MKSAKVFVLFSLILLMLSFPVYAAEQSNTPVTPDQKSTIQLGDINSASNKDNQVPLTGMAGQIISSQGTLTTTGVGNALISDQINNLTKSKNTPDWLKRTDLGFQLQDGIKPLYFIQTIQPLGPMTNKVTNFWQFRYGDDLSAGTVMNLGFGNRVLSNDKKSMFGENVFYDRGFRYGHERVGAGLEYFQGLGEYRVNYYRAISGEKLIDATNQIYEQALSGYDLEVGTSIANAPWAKIYIRGYHWNGVVGLPGINGWQERMVLQVFPQLQLEFGYIGANEGNGVDTFGGRYVKLMYNLGAKAQAMFEHNKPVFRTGDDVTVEGKRLEKVERQNDIIVEDYQKRATPSGSYNLTVKFSHI